MLHVVGSLPIATLIDTFLLINVEIVLLVLQIACFLGCTLDLPSVG